jgi:hypothetical protein
MASEGSDGWRSGDAGLDGAQLLTTTLAEPAISYDSHMVESATRDPAPTPVDESQTAGETQAPSTLAGTPPLGAAPPDAVSAASATMAPTLRVPGAPPDDLYAMLGQDGDDATTSETLAELAAIGVPTTPLRAIVPRASTAAGGEASTPDGDDLWASLSETPDPAPAASGVHALRSLLLGNGPDYEARLTLIEHRLEQLALYVTTEAQTARSDAERVPELGRRVDALAARVEDALDLARGGDVSVHAHSTLQRQVDELRLEQSELSETLATRIRALEERTRLRQREARTARRAELLRLRLLVYAPPETFGSSRLRAIERRAEQRAFASSGASELSGPALDAVRQGHDAGAAWRVFSHGIVVFFGALLTLIVVVARLTGEHLRDAWDHLMALFDHD